MNHADAEHLIIDRSENLSDPERAQLTHGYAHTDPIRFKDTLIYTENLKNCMIGMLSRILTDGLERSSPGK